MKLPANTKQLYENFLQQCSLMEGENVSGMFTEEGICLIIVYFRPEFD